MKPWKNFLSPLTKLSMKKLIQRIKFSFYPKKQAIRDIHAIKRAVDFHFEGKDRDLFPKFRDDLYEKFNANDTRYCLVAYLGLIVSMNSTEIGYYGHDMYFKGRAFLKELFKELDFHPKYTGYSERIELYLMYTGNKLYGTQIIGYFLGEINYHEMEYIVKKNHKKVIPFFFAMFNKNVY